MTRIYRNRYCPRCTTQVTGFQDRHSFPAGCLITLMTLGLYLPVWLLYDFIQARGGYRCASCMGRTLRVPWRSRP